MKVYRKQPVEFLITSHIFSKSIPEFLNFLKARLYVENMELLSVLFYYFIILFYLLYYSWQGLHLVFLCQGGHIFEKQNSLRFPGHFKILPWATQERKIWWNAFLLAIMSHSFIFPEFPGVFFKSSDFPEFSLSFPWDFDNFSNSLSFPGFPCFPGLWPPCLILIS